MLKRRLTLSMLVLAVCLFSMAHSARADYDNLQSVEETSPQEVVDGLSTKLFRGVTNIATGWLELPKQIWITSKEDGVAKGLAVGPLKGVGMTVVRTLVGVTDTALFLVPYPGFYDPIFDPAYVWQKE